MKKALLFVCLFALCNLVVLGQAVRSYRMSHTAERSAFHVPPQEAPAGLRKIYSNLGKSKTDLYNDTNSYVVSGPNSGLNFTQFIAMSFTPKSNSHVSQVRVAVQYVAGANQVNLSIYGDTNDAPGTLLAGPVTVMNLPAYGTCCTLAVAEFSPLAVTGGTQYWVVADTPLTGTGSDFGGGWDLTVAYVPQAANLGSGWFGFNGLNQAAGEVLGTVP